jgi:hypothetical protein
MGKSPAKTESSCGAITIARPLPGKGFVDLKEYLPETRAGLDHEYSINSFARTTSGQFYLIPRTLRGLQPISWTRTLALAGNRPRIWKLPSIGRTIACRNRLRARAAYFRRGRRGNQEPVRGTPDGRGVPIEDMGVDHGGGHILVPQQLLHGPDIVAIFKEVSSEGMPEGMTRSRLGNTRPTDGLLHDPLNGGFVVVVPVAFAGLAVHVDPGRREHPLPRPLTPGIRVLAIQRTRKGHPAGVVSKIRLVLPPCRIEMPRQVGFDGGRMYASSVLGL